MTVWEGSVVVGVGWTDGVPNMDVSFAEVSTGRLRFVNEAYAGGQHI